MVKTEDTTDKRKKIKKTKKTLASCKIFQHTLYKETKIKYILSLTYEWEENKILKNLIYNIFMIPINPLILQTIQFIFCFVLLSSFHWSSLQFSFAAESMKTHYRLKKCKERIQ